MNAINRVGKKDAKRGNRDLVLRFREVARIHQVTAVVVKGHAGDPHNEACHTAATKALCAKENSCPIYCLPSPTHRGEDLFRP